MPKKPLDYSKWSKIDVSDDEDEKPKHVDKASLFRWRHQSRLEKMAEMKRLRQALKKKREEVRRKMDDLTKQMEEATASGAMMEQDKLRAEMEELIKKDKGYETSEKELEQKDKSAPLNVDTLGRTGFNKSQINVSPSRTFSQQKPSVGSKKATTESFYRANQMLIRKFGTLNTFEETEQFLLDHPHVCCNEMTTVLASECINLEMRDERDLMKKFARQIIVMNYLFEISEIQKIPPSNPNLITTMMRRLKHARDNGQEDIFHKDVQILVDLVIEQLKEKKADAQKEREAEKNRNFFVGPRSLDPAEVLQSLPLEMRRCFQEKDMSGLERLAVEMPTAEFNYHFQRCIDSGLWIRKGENGQNSNRISRTKDDGPELKSYDEQDVDDNSVTAIEYEEDEIEDGEN